MTDNVVLFMLNDETLASYVRQCLDFKRRPPQANCPDWAKQICYADHKFPLHAVGGPTWGEHASRLVFAEAADRWQQNFNKEP